MRTVGRNLEEMAMARDWILLVMVCVGCTEPLQPIPPTTRTEEKPQKTDAGAASTATPAKAEKGEGTVTAVTDDDLMVSDAGSEPPDAGQPPDAGAIRAVAQDASADAANSPPAVVGTWAGVLRDPFNRAINACVVVTQVGTQGDAGHTWYTGAFTCECRLDYRETVGDVHSFDEIVTRGMGCPPVGILALEVKSDGTLKYDWYLNPGDIPEGVGTLNRVDRCE
jgi:hypothetical protein